VYLFPLGIGAGIYVSATGPDWFGDFFIDPALPWLIPMWIGAGFSFAWDVLRERAAEEGASSGVVAATGILSAVVIGGMLGVGTLMSEPSLIAVAVFPGLRLAEPWLRQPLAGARRHEPPPAGR
jgi:hypothetical protein